MTLVCLLIYFKLCNLSKSQSAISQIQLQTDLSFLMRITGQPRVVLRKCFNRSEKMKLKIMKSKEFDPSKGPIWLSHRLHEVQLKQIIDICCDKVDEDKSNRGHQQELEQDSRFGPLIPVRSNSLKRGPALKKAASKEKSRTCSQIH